jgi:hypothetical protein
MPEDMQDYLARMNKQLEEMAAQHLQVSSCPVFVGSSLAGVHCFGAKRCTLHNVLGLGCNPLCVQLLTAAQGW